MSRTRFRLNRQGTPCSKQARNLKFAVTVTYASATILLRIRIGNLDWNESREKKTKYIHASAADLLHIRIGNLDWCKCGHCKNEAREIDCLCCREVNAMLIASAKIPEREGSISPCRFMGNCLTVSHTCLLYLPRR